MTPIPTQELATRQLSEHGVPGAWRGLTRLLRQGGMGGPGFVRAWMRLMQTPGRRLVVIADRSFFLLPREADLVGIYHSVFREEAIDPTVVSWWETSDWSRDQGLAQRWPTRMLVNRSFLTGVLGTELLASAPEQSPAQVRRVFERLLDRLTQDQTFELAITDADLGPFNLMFVENQAGLLERLPERRGRETGVRAGLWLNGPEIIGGFVDYINDLWDRLPEGDRDREAVAGWLREHLDR